MSNLVISAPDEILSAIEIPRQLFSTIETPSDRGLVLLNSLSLNSVITASFELNSTILVGQGPAGVGTEDDVKYAKRMDAVGDDVIYKGEAVPGSLNNEPKWRILRITFVGEDLVEEWANGAADFVNMWSSRLILPYS